MSEFVEKDADELQEYEQTAAQDAAWTGSLMEINEPGDDKLSGK